MSSVPSLLIPKIYSWTYTYWSRPSDPINVIFYNIPLSDIERFLKGNSWTTTHIAASDQFLPFSDPKKNIYNYHKQDLQLVKQLQFHFTRYHVRLWDLGKGYVLAGVHMDRTRGNGHTSADFESIENIFAQECSSKWTVNHDAYDMGNRFAGYGLAYNNGLATVITP